MNTKTGTLLLCILLPLASCGKKSSNKSNSFVDTKTYFVNGDPLSLIAGSINNKVSIFKEESIGIFNDYKLQSFQVFTEKHEIIKSSEANQGTIESGNEAEDDNVILKEESFYSFHRVDDSYVYVDAKMPISFLFKKQGLSLNLDALVIGEFAAKAKIIHYSLKNDGTAFSMLIDLRDSSGTNLVSATFVKKAPKTISTTKEKYKYLAGPGVRVKWDQSAPVTLNICGSVSDRTKQIYRQGINLWKGPLEGKLTVEIKELLNYPPFNDLNVQCIYTVNNYLTEDDERFSNPATTFPILDTFNSKIVDSDIMVWIKEVEKGGSSFENSDNLFWTVGHEVGHFLGLDHQFDDSVTSIMSYDGTPYVSLYDRNAIEELYKVEKP